jgi:uncharacterized protein YukE
MSLKGMDTDAVRQLAAHMNNAKDQILHLQQQLTHQLQAVNWIGPDREQFVSDWQGQHIPALQNVIQAIEQAAQRATQNASEQDQVSA